MKKHPKENAIKSTNIRIIAVALTSFGLASLTQAVVPAPDGGYPGLTPRKGKELS